MNSLILENADCRGAGAASHPTNFIVYGSTWTAVWRFSLPLLANMLVLASSNLVEGWIAGRLGPDAQAAAGIGGQVWYFMILLTLALSAGTTAVVSRCYGARNRAVLGQAVQQAIILAIVVGISSAAIGFASCRTALELLGASSAVAALGFEYLKFSIVSIIPSTILWVLNSIFRACGDSWTPMLTQSIVTVIAMVLGLGLCLGPGHLGITGIGISWLVATSVGSAIGFRSLQRTELHSYVRPQVIIRQPLSTNWMLRFLKIGLPACLQDISLLVSSFGIFAFLARTAQPVVGQAAWAAGWRVEETFTIMPMYALNMAAATLVGQNIGAGRIKRARRLAWQVTAIGVLWALFVGVLMLSFSHSISSALSDVAPVVASCNEYLRATCASQPFLATWLILSGAMQGAAYTRLPMAATVFSFNALRFALCWLLCFGLSLGPHGIWVAIAASTVVGALLMIWMWSANWWQNQQL